MPDDRLVEADGQVLLCSAAPLSHQYPTLDNLALSCHSSVSNRGASGPAP